jgi:hypothetical protein
MAGGLGVTELGERELDGFVRTVLADAAGNEFCRPRPPGRRRRPTSPA